MSIFIHSYDYTSGTSSEGTWEFGQSLHGNYRVAAQTMDTQTYPWMWLGQDTMVLRVPDPMQPLVVYDTFAVTFDPSLGLENNVNTIATTMTSVIQSAIDQQTLLHPYVARTVSSNVNTTNQTIEFTFDEVISVLWQHDVLVPYESTINASVGKANAPSEENVTTFSISYVDMVTDPKFLEVYIEESATQYINTHGTTPTLLFSTRDTEFTGQTFELRTETTELNISIKKMGSTQVLPLTGAWYLVLTPF